MAGCSHVIHPILPIQPERSLYIETKQVSAQSWWLSVHGFIHLWLLPCQNNMQEHKQGRYRYFNSKCLLNLSTYQIAHPRITVVIHMMILDPSKIKYWVGMAVYFKKGVCNVLGYTTFNVNKTLQLFFQCLNIIQYSTSTQRHIHTSYCQQCTWQVKRPHAPSIKCLLIVIC